MSRWLLPSAPAAPPSLDAVDELVFRQYHGRTRDIPYAALQGDEVVPQRPHVVYLSGALCDEAYGVLNIHPG